MKEVVGWVIGVIAVCITAVCMVSIHYYAEYKTTELMTKAGYERIESGLGPRTWKPPSR